MRSPEIMSLPIASQEYLQSNEQTARRTMEQYLSDLRNDVVVNEQKKGKDSSLAVRRLQFLLMGS